MNLWKFAFRLSLIANLALIVWVVNDRIKAQREENEQVIALDKMIEDVDRMEQDLKDEHLRQIASIDQLDAFLEEHRNHAG